MSIFDIEIINWHKVNTFKFWPGLFFTLCHPIYAWKYDRQCYGSFLNRCERFFREVLPSYTPFSRASRWLAHMLVKNLVDTKYITNFYARARGSFSTYYFGRGLFGYYSLYKVYWRKIGKGYAKTPTKTKIVSGWVFRKKTAIALYKKIVVENADLYTSEYQPCADIAHPWIMNHVMNMKSLLYFGKFNTEEYIDSIYYEERFNKTKDNIEKLWCYMAHLLSCPNDFMAHEKLAWIFRTCDSYLYYKEMKVHPEIDETYNLTLKNLGKKEAKKWQNQQVKDHSNIKTSNELIYQIKELEDFYKNQPFDYYRI